MEELTSTVKSELLTLSLDPPIYLLKCFFETILGTNWSWSLVVNLASNLANSQIVKLHLLSGRPIANNSFVPLVY